MAHSWKMGWGKEYHYPDKERDDSWKKERQLELFDKVAKEATAKELSKSSVSAPPHYRFGGNLQTIDLIHEVLSKQQDGFLAYCLGNVFKYLTRFGRKDGLNDLKKALQYLTWMVEHVEKGEINPA